MYLHVLWSTLNQQTLITDPFIPHLHNYLCHLTLKEGCNLIYGRVFCDHIQLVIKFTPFTILADLITNLKVASLLWMRTNFPGVENFEWQKSDFGFSVGVDEVGVLIESLQKSKPFTEEVFALLDQNEMEYDPVEVLE